MAITVEARTEIIGLVVGMFGAAPGASVLSDLVAAKEAGASIKQIAANVANTVEFKSIYPTFLTNAEFATQLLNNLVGSLVPAADKANAVVEITAMLNATGATRSSVLVDVITALNAVPSTHPVFGNAAAAFDNKVAVATYFSVDKAQSGASLDALQDVISAVDNTAASVTAAKAVIDGEAQAGGTFTLTTSATDVVNGTTNDDVIIGDFNTDSNNNGTVQASDSIDGGSGNDTLKLFSFGVAGAQTALPVTVKNVETINFVAATNNTAINTAAMTGVTTVKLEQADAYSGVVTTGAAQGLALNTATQMAAALTWNASATDTAASLTLAGFNDNAQGLTITGAATKTLNIASTTATNTVSLAAPATVTKVAVTGDKTLDLTGAALAATIVTLDASAATGSVKATLLATGATVTGGAAADTIQANLAVNKTVINLGAGDDTLKLGAIASISADSTYAGGEGTDTVQFTDGSKLTTVNGKQFTGFETLSTGTGTGTYNVEAISGITAVKVDGALAGAVVIDKVTTQNVTVSVSTGAQNLTVQLKDATGTADTVAVNIKGAAAVTVNHLITDAIETVSISSSGKANVITSLDIDDATTLTLTGDQQLTVTGFANADTITKIDASALSKGFVMGGVTAATTAATYIGGAGADTFLGNATGDTFYGAGGGDTITLGATAKADTIVIKAASDSKIGLDTVGTLDLTNTDKVTAGFISGEDSVDLGAFGFTGSAQSGLLGKGAVALQTLATSGSVDFFNDGVSDRGVAIGTFGGNTYVFVDANKDGNFTAADDAVIQFTGVAIVLALNDFGF